MKSERLLGFQIEAFLAVSQSAPAQIVVNDNILPVIALQPDGLVPWLDANQRPHVVVAVDEEELKALSRQVEQLSLRYKDIHVIPPIAGLPLFGVVPYHFFSHEVLLLRVTNNLTVRSLMLMKRMFDLCGAAVGLLLLSPLFVYAMWQIKRQAGRAPCSLGMSVSA